MNASLLLACFLLAQPEPCVEMEFAQVAPAPREAKQIARSPKQDRAILLIHGLRLHPFSTSNVNKAEMSSWQKPKSSLVTTLSKEADVFSLAYSQNASLDTIANLPELVGHVRQLKKLGYRDIVLVGHSIGGVLARHLVEDHPELGVTKVIQVASPNAGSGWAKATWGVRKNQEAFLESITHEGREKTLAGRAQKKIPDGVAFVCVVCRIPITVNAAADLGKVEVDVTSKRGDGVVSCGCQWSADVQAQGIPAIVLDHTHFTAMRGPSTAEALVRLIRETPGRWNAEQVNGARVKILGPTKIAP